MAHAGQIIFNKVTGERLQYIQTSNDTNKKFTKFRLWVSPKGNVPVRHIHPELSETVEVISGVFKVECDGQFMHLKPGETFTIAKGKPHQWWNESDSQDAEVIFTIEPAGQFEAMQEQIFGILNAKGKLSFLQIMVMAEAYDMFIAGPPIFIQKIMWAMLSPIGRLLGLKKYYAEYSL